MVYLLVFRTRLTKANSFILSLAVSDFLSAFGAIIGAYREETGRTIFKWPIGKVKILNILVLEKLGLVEMAGSNAGDENFPGSAQIYLLYSALNYAYTIIEFPTSISTWLSITSFSLLRTIYNFRIFLNTIINFTFV